MASISRFLPGMPEGLSAPRCAHAFAVAGQCGRPTQLALALALDTRMEVSIMRVAKYGAASRITQAGRRRVGLVCAALGHR